MFFSREEIITQKLHKIAENFFGGVLLGLFFVGLFLLGVLV